MDEQLIRSHFFVRLVYLHTAYQVIHRTLLSRSLIEGSRLKPEVTFAGHGQLPCYFSLTLEAATCKGQTKQGLKQGISLEMSRALSLNTDRLRAG